VIRQLKALAALALMLCPPLAWSAEWAQWHGPNRDSLSAETGLLKTWPKGGPRLLWTTKGLGKGYSIVSIKDGTIYTSGAIGKQTYVIALGLDGKPKWKSPNGTAWKPEPWARFARTHGGARATPTLDDGMAYHLNELGRLAAFDAKTGTEKWAIDTPGRFEAKGPKWGYAESVLIIGDHLICYPGGKKGYLVALNKKTGELVWANTTIGQAASYCSPMLVEVAGLTQIITSTADGVLGADPTTGTLLWSHPHTNMRKINVINPVCSGDRVFISNGYGGGSVQVKLTVTPDAVRAGEAWKTKAPDNHHGGMVLIGDHLYGSGHYKKGWGCFEFKTGKETWRTKQGKGSILYADGMLYCLDERGTMTLVKPSPAAFKAVSKFKVPPGGEGLYWAHPVVCDGRLYIRHADRLYAYDIRAR